MHLIEFDPAKLSVAVTLVIVANRIVEGLVVPIREKIASDKGIPVSSVRIWWLVYVSWGVGSLLVGLAQLNLFESVYTGQMAIVGILLTAIAIGGGAGILSTGIDTLRAYQEQANAKARDIEANS